MQYSAKEALPVLLRKRLETNMLCRAEKIGHWGNHWKQLEQT